MRFPPLPSLFFLHSSFSFTLRPLSSVTLLLTSSSFLFFVWLFLRSSIGRRSSSALRLSSSLFFLLPSPPVVTRLSLLSLLYYFIFIGYSLACLCSKTTIACLRVCVRPFRAELPLVPLMSMYKTTESLKTPGRALGPREER